MNIKKLVKNKTVRAIGWALLVLWSLLIWLYVFDFNFRTIIYMVAGYGLLMLLIGVASLIYKIFSPQMKIIAQEIVLGALYGWLTGMFITILQRWIFKFPSRFTGKLVLSNSIIAAIFILWRRWEKKSEEPDD